VGAVSLAVGAWLLTPESFGYHSGGAERVGKQFAKMTPPMAMTITGVVLLVVAWCLCGRVALSTRRAVWTAVAWAAPMAAAPPLLSADMYAYADQGWQQLHGMNPYVVGLSEDTGPFAHVVSSYWHGTTAVYGPLALRLQAAAVWFAGDSVPAAILALRLISVLAVIGMGVGVVVLGRQHGIPAGRALWWAVLNPMTIAHLIGGGHNDAPAGAGIILAIALATRRHGWLWAGLLIGAAACFKQPALLAAVFAGVIVARTGRDEIRPGGRGVVRVIVAVATVVGVALGAFIVIHLLCGLGFGWTNAMSVPGVAATFAPFSLVMTVTNRLTGLATSALPGWLPAVVLWSVRGVLVLAFLALLVRWRRRPVLIAGVGLSAASLALDAFRTWYLGWGFGLLVIGGGRRVLGIAAGGLAALMLADVLREYARIDRLVEFGIGCVFGLVVGVVVARSLPARLAASPGGVGSQT